MSSLIPKINIGVDTHNGRFDLSCMTHATSEIGYVMPTFSKYIVPKSRVSIGTRTGSRLSPLFVPTMGQIEIRHYHCFVPFNTIWFPYDAFLTGTNYTLPDGTTYIPKRCPYFRVRDVFHYLLDGSVNLSVRFQKECTMQIFDEFGNSFDTEWVSENISSIIGGLSNALVGSYIKTSDGYLYVYKLDNEWVVETMDQEDGAISKLSFPSYNHRDFSDVSTVPGTPSRNYIVTYNLNGSLKRLRSIFLGLGYSFNPYDTELVTPFKLMAFYKSYWSLFGVNRTYNFFNTYCYKLIKALSESTVLDMSTLGVVNAAFVQFIATDLTKCTYTCPADYFSASDTVTGRGAGDGVAFNSPMVGERNGETFNKTIGAINVGNTGVATSHNTGLAPDYAIPLAQKIGLRLLRFVNKNSVIGRQISEILRARYGVSDIHNALHEQVERVGASKTPINISAVYNNTDSGNMPLGSYAGLGVSGQNGAISKKYTFQTKEFGVLLTLTAVVPKMGYFQGMFRENSDGTTDNTEFYTPEYDAIAWQSVRYNELIADRQFKSPITHSGEADAGTQLGIFGYNPTYQHYKVSFNRCLGDISLPSKSESMLPYTLDRYFPNSNVEETGVYDLPELPPNEPMYFRSGTRGETNRIFSDMSPTDDHVIMQIFFDIKMSAPMKSIANSYDTIDEESTHTTEVAHE